MVTSIQIHIFFSTGVWTQGAELVGMCSTMWAMPALFALIIFYIGSHFMFRLAWASSLFILPHIVGDDRHIPPCPAICWNGSLWTFCTGWPRTEILLISVSQAVRITGVRYDTQLQIHILNKYSVLFPE
jgi:hypothetical protein